MSQHVPLYRSQSETLFWGKILESALVISSIISGYLLSQVTRKRRARPLGQDKLPSPRATPTTYAKVVDFSINTQIISSDLCRGRDSVTDNFFQKFLLPQLDCRKATCLRFSSLSRKQSSLLSPRHIKKHHKGVFLMCRGRDSNSHDLAIDGF